MATALVAIIRTRIELFSLEASEQKSQLLALLGWLACAVVFLLLGLVVFTVTLALLFWPTEGRYVALFVLAVCYLAAGLVCIGFVRRLMAQADSPFAVTLQELHNDLLTLESLRNSDEAASAPPRSSRTH